MRRRKEETREEYLERRRRYRLKPEQKAKARAYFLKYRERDQNNYRERSRRYSFKQYLGISREQADAMAAKQGNRCAICGQTPNGKKNHARLHVDHDRRTGKIREMLCSYCNRGLGCAKESIDNLARMIVYLRKHGSGVD